VTLRHRRLKNCPSRHTSNCPPATTYLENSVHKSLFRNTLPITLFDGILCESGRLISILCAKNRGGGGVPQRRMAAGQVFSPDDLQTWSLDREKQIPRGRLTAAKGNVRWRGMALAVPKACLMPKGFSPGQPRLKPFLMEFDFTALYGAPEGAPLQERVENRLFQQPVKPVRDDKHRELATAQLKLRSFKSTTCRVLQQPVKSVRDDKHKGLERGAEALHYPNESFPGYFPQTAPPRAFDLAKSERRIAKSGHTSLGGSHAG
jgi:hypothetical protein